MAATSCATGGDELALDEGLTLFFLTRLPLDALRLSRLALGELSFLFSGSSSEEEDDDLFRTGGDEPTLAGEGPREDAGLLLTELPLEVLRLSRLALEGLSFLFSGSNSEDDEDDLCNVGGEVARG